MLFLSLIHVLSWYPSGTIKFILLNFNSLTASFTIKPKLFTPNAEAKFNGPELLPTKNSEFFIAVITPVRSLFEQSIKYFSPDDEIIFFEIQAFSGPQIKYI